MMKDINMESYIPYTDLEIRLSDSSGGGYLLNKIGSTRTPAPNPNRIIAKATHKFKEMWL